MKIVVIVITYNGGKWVDKCFGSLVSSTLPLTILAIDNASSDDTVKQIKTKYPSVQVIETGSNLGFGKANNIGFKYCLQENADYVFLLNQDAWIENSTIEELIKVSAANPEYGIISPFHLLPVNKELEWHFSTYISADKCKDLVSDIYAGKTKDIYELEFVNAAAWLITKKCLLEVGGFDPLFPHYGEDDDYCNRVIYKGMKIGVTPRARIIHDISRKSWEEIKFNPERQLIFSLIELKNIRLSYKFLLFNYIQQRSGRLLHLFFMRKWREFFFMNKMFFRSLSYVNRIGHSRKLAKKDHSYLN